MGLWEAGLGLGPTGQTVPIPLEGNNTLQYIHLTYIYMFSCNIVGMDDGGPSYHSAISVTAGLHTYYLQLHRTSEGKIAWTTFH